MLALSTKTRQRFLAPGRAELRHLLAHLNSAMQCYPVASRPERSRIPDPKRNLAATPGREAKRSGLFFVAREQIRPHLARCPRKRRRIRERATLAKIVKRSRPSNFEARNEREERGEAERSSQNRCK